VAAIEQKNNKFEIGIAFDGRAGGSNHILQKTVEV
jgi:hypothetical protein